MRSRVAVFACAVLLGACTDEPVAPASEEVDAAAATQQRGPGPDAPRVTCDAGNGGITLPAGFCAVVVADAVGPARHIAVAENGDAYVAIDGKASAGGVLALRDANGDGRAETQQYFGATDANGIVVTREWLYVAYRDRVVRHARRGGALLPDRTPQVIVAGLPADGGDHDRKNVQLDGAGAMYVNVGSASNACQVANRALRSPGIDPCPELATRAGVWRFVAWRQHQRQSDGERFATGLRNMEALRYDAASGRLFGLQHGRDHLNDNWPALYTVEQGALLPSEEYVRIDRGDDNGWPYCYHDWQKGLKVLAPEYGGNGTVVGPRCATKEVPLLAFPGHWAPNDLLFYQGTQFPARYRGGAFVAFHGGHDRTPLPNEGYNVVFVPRTGGVPSRAWEVFADGFTGGGTPLPANAAHRPMGLAEGPDGSLYVTDDRGGRIWRIVYR